MTDQDPATTSQETTPEVTTATLQDDDESTDARPGETDDGTGKPSDDTGETDGGSDRSDDDGTTAGARRFATMIDESIAVGVIGVGNMGRHHARVYTELPGAKLVGISDVDRNQARTVAETYGTTAIPFDRLLETVDAVSIAVPDRYHYEIARRALDAGVHVLVEKPFVVDPADGRDLVERAERAGLVLQVGHVERFNPAVRTLSDVLEDCSVLAIEANRLGPPLDRDGTENPVLDLMIHDIDVVCAVLGDDVASVRAAAAADGAHMTALVTFADGTTATLTASRVTQQKVRTLSVTAAECRVNVDYIDQSVEIHRRSIPEHVAVNGNVRYRHEGVIERPMVDRGEPLKNELQSFVDAVREGTDPVVTGEDGLRALELARRIEAAADGRLEQAEVAR